MTGQPSPCKSLATSVCASPPGSYQVLAWETLNGLFSCCWVGSLHQSWIPTCCHLSLFQFFLHSKQLMGCTFAITILHNSWLIGSDDKWKSTHTTQWLTNIPLTFFYHSSNQGRWPLLKMKLMQSSLGRAMICFPGIFTPWMWFNPLESTTKWAVLGTRDVSLSVISLCRHLLSCHML